MNPQLVIEASLDEVGGDPDRALDLIVERYGASDPTVVSVASEVLSQPHLRVAPEAETELRAAWGDR